MTTTPRKPGEAHPVVQLAILVAIFAVVLNVAFYFISDTYFADRAVRFGAAEAERLGATRVHFATFTVATGLALVLAGAFPRAVGHGIPGIASAASLIAAIAVFAQGMPLTLGTTLLLLAGLLVVLLWHSLRGSRPAWASLVALCAVYAVVTLFAAPKLRNLLGIGLWQAMILPGVFSAAVGALRAVRADYRELG